MPCTLPGLRSEADFLTILYSPSLVCSPSPYPCNACKKHGAECQLIGTRASCIECYAQKRACRFEPSAVPRRGTIKQTVEKLLEESSRLLEAEIKDVIRKRNAKLIEKINELVMG
jgi:hypothetical protein